MFERELEKLTRSDRTNLERLVETAVRELLVGLDNPQLDQQQLFLKCANIRAVFKLASALRQTTSSDA